MKTRIIKSLLTLVMAVMALPILSQNYLTIYLKNGNKERHLMSLIQEITTSKYDQAGVLHSDYVSQVVSINDILYYYSLDDIDSISFQKVEESEIIQNIESATSKIEEILNNCESFDDLCSFSQIIADTPGVEDVQQNDNSLVIRIKDWRRIVFLNPLQKEKTKYTRKISSNPSNLIKNAPMFSPQINKSVKVAIIDQNTKNEDPLYVKDTEPLLQLKDEFDQLGYSVDYIPQPSIDFFFRDLFSYDIVMLTTHGGYIDNIHWYLTGEEVGNYSNEVYAWLGIHDWLSKYADDDDVAFTYVPETRNGKSRWIAYAMCSELFLDKSPFFFKNGNALVFTNVCESLKENDSMAEVFLKRGAYAYFGYDESTGCGEDAGKEFFDGMLNGKNAQLAFDEISSDLKYEENTRATLRKVPTINNDLPCFITKTITAPNTEVKDIELENGEHQITITGYTTSLDKKIIGGFELSGSPDFKNVQSETRTLKKTDNNNGNYYFELSLTAYPGTTFYYRAYTFDNFHHNYGNTCSYDVLANLRVSTHSVTLEEGKNSSVTITSGNGIYTAKSNKENVATASVNGNEVIVNAISEGDAIITITDTKTNQTTEVAVKVIKKPSQDIALSTQEVYLNVGETKQIEVTAGSGHYSVWIYAPEVANVTVNGNIITIKGLSSGKTIVKVTDTTTNKTIPFGIEVKGPSANEKDAVDLGLSVKWAKMNVGAVSEEDCGEHYAWGETESKSYFSWSSYDFCNGTESTISKYNNVDGKTMLDPSNDAAHVIMGGNWRTPTLTEMEELVNRCKWTVETLNGVKGARVTGPNGNSIFLPFGGQMFEDQLSHYDNSGYYYASTLSSNGEKYAPALCCFGSGNKQEFVHYARYYGLSIRGVFSK